MLGKWHCSNRGSQDAREFVNKMYVAGALFKPAMAKEQPFRIEENDAVSYFVGGCQKIVALL